MTDVIKQRIDRIKSNVTRSSEIIDGLLSLARVSRQELLNERVDLSVPGAYRSSRTCAINIPNTASNA